MNIPRLLSVLFSILFLAVFFTTDIGNDYRPYNYLLCLFIQIYIAVCCRKNIMLFFVVFVLLLCDYSIIYANFIAPIGGTIYTSVITSRVTHASLNILTAFSCALACFFNWSVVKESTGDNMFVMLKNHNSMIAYSMIPFLVLIFIFGFTAPTEIGQRGAPTTYYEYAIVLFIVLFYYSGDDRFVKYVGLLLVAAYALQNFIFGGRISGLQFILCAFFMLYMQRFTLRKLLVYIVPVYVLLTVIGSVRGRLLMGDYSVASILQGVMENGFALDTAYAAYYTSETFVYIHDHMIPSERYYYLMEWLKSIVVGATGNEDANLAWVSLRYIPHTFGGILPFFFYFYMGKWGVLIPAFLVSLYVRGISSLRKYKSGYLRCLCVFIACQPFRWYLYSPSPLLRGAMLFTIAFFLTYLAHRWMAAPSKSVRIRN